MNYLTKREQARVAAHQSYTPRKLTAVELLLKDVETAFLLPSNNQEFRKIKEEVVETLCKRGLELTATERLSNRIKLACYSAESLENLIDDYPYVKFGDVIGTANYVNLSAIEQAAAQGRTLEELQRVVHVHYAKPQQVLKELMDYIPKGVKTIVWTPPVSRSLTNLREFRKETKNSLAYGISLPQQLQKSVNMSYEQFLVKPAELPLLKVDNLFKRLRLSEETIKSFDASSRVEITHGVKIAGLVISGQLTKVVDKEKGNELYFVI